jgi:hypothetical protein
MYNYDLLDVKDFEIVEIGKKTVYNTDKVGSLKEFVKGTKTKKIDYPKFSSSLVIKETKLGGGMAKTSFGTLVSESNNILGSQDGCYIVTGGISRNIGNVEIDSSNIRKVFSVFSVRKIVKGNWLNEIDEYLSPDEDLYQKSSFQNDSIVYSLFNNLSEQSSLRQVTYKDQLWDIKNEFFWMSVEKMKELADQNGYDELYNDARTSSDRYVHKLLFGEERIYDRLSPDAKEVLDKATELVERSMELRQVMANNENHLNSWDAGYAQLKLVWKEYFQKDFKEFRQLYKNLEDRMRPLVYELGFLIK